MTSLPLPLNDPNGVTNMGTMRVSPGGRLGNIDQLLGCWAQLPPCRMRSSIPCVTWPTDPPVCVFTQNHGCGVLQSDAYDGQAADRLIVYWGWQPWAISPRRLETAGSQSIDWFWLPTTRRAIGGLETLV